ncbi:MAG: hypothetical protein WCA98_11360 [Candidatus Acidiferrales bacterium]
MKSLLGVAMLTLLFSIPTHAQGSLNGPAGLNGANSMNGIGSIADNGSLATHGSLKGPAFPTLASRPTPSFRGTSAKGSASTFVPSTFVQYKDALAEGRAAEATTPKPLAQVAAEYRETKREKARFAIVGEGNAKIVTLPE